MSQEETTRPQSSAGQASTALQSEYGSKGKTRFWRTLETFGATQSDIKMISDFMLPVISDFVFFKTVGELGNSMIEAIDRSVQKRGGDEALRALSIDIAYEKKTGRSMQQEILEYMDSLSDALEEVRETVEAVIRQVDVEGGNEEEKEKKLNDIFQKIVEQRMEELNKMYI